MNVLSALIRHQFESSREATVTGMASVPMKKAAPAGAAFVLKSQTST
jgi:hypothetical protein